MLPLKARSFILEPIGCYCNKFEEAAENGTIFYAEPDFESLDEGGFWSNLGYKLGYIEACPYCRAPLIFPTRFFEVRDAVLKEKKELKKHGV